MIALNVPYLQGNEKKYLIDVIESGWLARGKYTEAFEQAFCAKISHTKYGVAVTSGTVAVHVALRSVGLFADEYGQEAPKVAVPSYTCMSVPAGIRHAGCAPIFIEVESETFGMDIESVERMYKKTHFVGLVLVHNYGFMARDTIKIVEFCKKNRIKLIEDASEAHGAELNGKRAGEFGDVAAFSVRSEKMIGVGEGGIVVTNSKEYHDNAYYWVNDARPSNKIRYYVTAAGWNFHMANALGAIGLAQVEQFDEIVRRKRQVGEWYASKIDTLEGYLRPMKKAKGSKAVYWLNVFYVDETKGLNRDDLMTVLESKGIETRPGFYPLHLLPPYRKDEADKCVMTQIIGRDVIALPSNPYMTEADVDGILTEIIKVIYGKG